MNAKNKLRNTLVRRLQQLSAEKLTEIHRLLDEIEGDIKSKDQTLNLAGSWKGLDDNVFEELTKNLHDNRANDRPISQS